MRIVFHARHHLSFPVVGCDTNTEDPAGMGPPELAISHQDIEAFCLRHHIRKLSLFGSILTSRFRRDSDVDVLVEFEPGHVPGYFDLAGMELEISAMLGRQVDLRTAEELSPYFRDHVIATAAVQYERE
jgi:predicted nucleotidyltransferase